MDTFTKETAYAAGLGAMIGLLFTIGQTAWWGPGSYGDLTLPSLLSAAAIGAVAGILAFEIRRRM